MIDRTGQVWERFGLDGLDGVMVVVSRQKVLSEWCILWLDGPRAGTLDGVFEDLFISLAWRRIDR